MNRKFSIFKLSDVADIIVGGDKPKIFSTNKSSSNIIPVFANSEKKDRTYGYTNTARITEPAVTIAARGTVGFVKLRKEPYFPIIRLLSLIPKRTKLDVNYLYYNLKLYRQTGIGSNQPQITNQSISSRSISLPSLHIQQKISRVLSSLDNKIELNNKINIELEAMAKLIYDYWFVQFDFPDENGKPYKSSGGKMVYNKELKREIPYGWTSNHVGKLLVNDLSKQKVPKKYYQKKGIIPVIDQSSDFIAGYTDDHSSLIETEEPRIIFGDHTRIFKLVNFNFARGADGTKCLLSKNRNVPQHFFYHSLLKIDLSNYGYSRYFKFLKESQIIVPTFAVSSQFEKITNSLYSQIKNNVFETIKLEELRDWLLPMLMNGQVTVSEERMKSLSKSNN